MKIEQFPLLKVAGLLHGFSTRSEQDSDAAKNRAFEELGFRMARAAQVAQPHGSQVAVWDEGSVVGSRPEADAIVTQTLDLPIVIRVADCGAVFFYDPVKRAIGLAHSGKKGTQADIVGATIGMMKSRFNTSPTDLLVQLGPCIRPPYYEVNFAQQIADQARNAGVVHFEDCGIGTACHLDKYYSYRAEKGQTGRMWAVMMLTK